eukprot:4664390-Amphidinium_carterae.2
MTAHLPSRWVGGAGGQALSVTVHVWRRSSEGDPSVPGLWQDPHGFVPAWPYCHVEGVVVDVAVDEVGGCQHTIVDDA